MEKLEKELSESRKQRGLLSQEKADLYESYALGKMDVVSYREKAEELTDQNVLLSVREKELLNELDRIREEFRKTEEDMRQIIRFFRMEKLRRRRWIPLLGGFICIRVRGLK